MPSSSIPQNVIARCKRLRYPVWAVVQPDWLAIAHTDGTQMVRSALTGTNQTMVGAVMKCGTFEAFLVASFPAQRRCATISE